MFSVGDAGICENFEILYNSFLKVSKILIFYRKIEKSRKIIKSRTSQKSKQKFIEKNHEFFTSNGKKLQSIWQQ